MNNVISFYRKRKQKQTAETISRGRIPLSISHGKVFGTEQGDSEFTERMARIRTSLEKINSLMTELKQSSLNSKE